ncbi:acetolactate synthase large subunit [Blattabacterium sp. (Blattella germanica) str. Bge]|uniref:biosynthetic-type acetolactate synthase large subunit n=1 Tax=Blattabacterium sp. (Blattella germanica) TaxID=624186 RepID=UPI0001BB6262|nr:biosynthetic-type acetolactate synthase large subunit [Blattabacterium sp. (Blattella germanica)]ACY40556.1 acetolactate synthase large subunit [Blattabacterium sp. (Blattella germanica) str. Bge]
MEKKLFSGSEIVIKALLHEEVEYIFGYPGGAIMPIYDSLHDYLNLVSHILMRHEQGSIHAAQGYARATGKIGVCFTTSGPGATNLITGLADALIDSTPLVCITGQVSSHLLGTDAFQETNIIDISIPVTKWNTQVLKSKDICESIQKGFFIAKRGRPGPVLIDITKDAQFQKSEFHYERCKYVKNFHPYPCIEENRIIEAANFINKANKPLILVGQGVILAEAEEEFKKFVEKTGIPVASTLLGLGVLDSNHYLYVGMLGMHGNYAPNILTNQCDILIAIGIRFDDRVTGDVKQYAKQAKIIHLEIDPSEVNKNILCHIPILGDCKCSLRKLINYVNESTHEEWIKKFCALKEREKIAVIQGDLNPKKEGMTMGEVIKWINQYKQKNAILVTDVGQHQMIASRYFNFTYKRSQITSGGLGTMGFALPASIGAQLGAKNRQVICIVGDGGIQMTIQEMGTILQNDIPVKIILLNNNFLGMVRQWQQLFFDKRYSCTELVNPDFIKLANAYNIEAKKVNKREELKESVKKALNHEKAFLLEVVIEREDNVFPMIPAGAAVDKIRLT